LIEFCLTTKNDQEPVAEHITKVSPFESSTAVLSKDECSAMAFAASTFARIALEQTIEDEFSKVSMIAMTAGMKTRTAWVTLQSVHRSIQNLLEIASTHFGQHPKDDDKIVQNCALMWYSACSTRLQIQQKSTQHFLRIVVPQSQEHKVTGSLCADGQQFLNAK